ncbi:MAG: manganese efflux pump [Lachnospiraceae bacterium]|nr:manganese efflux pump [Lachnospiraceae bacterium]
MDLFTLILLALGLATDAFAVSLSNGMCACTVTKKHAIATAFTFGFFQAAMPILGYFLGCTFSDVVSRFQHWIALFLLGAIGVNMIWDAIKDQKNPEDCSNKNIFTVSNLIIQGIATSIDALAVGVSLAVINVNILTSSLVIGIITFICCIFGVYLGHKFGSLLGIHARLIGGILLILIGLRIFIEHQIQL